MNKLIPLVALLIFIVSISEGTSTSSPRNNNREEIQDLFDVSQWNDIQQKASDKKQPNSNEELNIEELLHEEDTILTIDFNNFLMKSDFEILSKFSLEGIVLDENTYLLDFQQSDINGDNIEDNVLMTGIHLQGYSAPYQEDITVIIQDGKNKKITFLYPKNAYGYGYGVSMGDFDGDKTNDILFSVNNDCVGGGGQYTFAIYSFDENKFKVLFDNKKVSEEIRLKTEFMDMFKFKVYYQQLSKVLCVDLGAKKEKYKGLNLYIGDRLREKTEGDADNYCVLVPKDVDKDGVLELEGVQYVSGYGRADGIGMATSILKLDNNKQKWILQDFYFEKFDD